MFDLGRLRLLRDLSQRGTMTAVAAASRLTPSAVSQQLSTLEAEAAVKLFEPVGRRVQLTGAGLRLAAHAQTILDAVQAAQVDMGVAATQPDGRIAIACFGTYAKSHLLPAIGRTRSRHAGLDVIVSELEPVDALDALRTGRCDAAIVYAHNLVPRPHTDGFATRPLMREPMLLALPGRYAHLPATVELSELADCDWIGGARESEGYVLTQRACAVAGFAPRITHSIDDYDLLLRMVAAGLGISFVPQLALDLYPTEGIVVRKAAGIELTRSISWVTRAALAATPSLLAILNQITATTDLDRQGRRL